MFFGLLGLLCPAVSAFAPSDEVWIGIEPNRIYRVNPSLQARMRLRPAWASFVDGEGYGWQARFDERTGTARRAWGPGIPMGTLSTAQDVDRGLRALFTRNPDLLGVPRDQLRIKSANYVERLDTWYVDYDRLVDGARIWDGGVTARIVAGQLVLLGVQTYPELTDVDLPSLSRDEAIRAAELDGPASMAVHTEQSARLVVLPREIKGELTFPLTWEVRSRTEAPVGQWVSHVDAHTGEILNVYNEVKFFDGTLYGTHDTRTVNGSFTTSALPLATLTGTTSGTRVSTALDGTFTTSGTESWSTFLSGSYVTVSNQGGSNGALTFPRDASAPTWTSSNADLAEIDTYVFLHHVRDWGLRFAPEAVTSAIVSYVNIDSACNAYWDGSVNFFRAGSGCNNTGRIADVAYHEWGHGFHYYSLRSGSFDSSMSEGIGDVVAVMQTFDPLIAPYFSTAGYGIRELATDRVYPDDMSAEVHANGLIFGGAMWDLYGLLSETYNEDVGDKGTAWATTSQLLADAIKGGPTIGDSYEEVLLADDDNADLSDGTPHECEIMRAFGPHGLGPAAGGGSLISLGHDAIGNQLPDAPIPLAGDVRNLAPLCASVVETVEVRYSTDGGSSWDSAPLDLVGETFSGELPALPSGTVVEYYLHASAEDGTQASLPAGGEIAPYTFYVGALEELYCENFRNDGGYTHELIRGERQDGADDWTYDSPQGYAGDPERPHTGRSNWGNDLGGGMYNGAYQSKITNRLSSVPIDVQGNAEVMVQFRRWLNVEDGHYDQANVYADGEIVWTNYATDENGVAHTEDREWMLHTLRVDTSGDHLTLGWGIKSDEGAQFGGWNIDDVCVYRMIDPPAEVPIDKVDPDSGSCGCATGSGTEGGILLAAAAGLITFVRRRRLG